MPAALVIGSLVLQGVSMIKQNEAAKDSESLSRSVARRNANIDLTAAKQSELDTAANIQAARDEANVFTSRQNTSYAASGVLSNTGSPLAVQAQTMGQFEQRIQQEKINATQRQLQLQDAAQYGVLYGDAQAKAINTANTAAMLKGGAQLLSTAYGGYKSGALSTGAGTNWDDFNKMDFVGGTDGSKFNY